MPASSAASQGVSFDAHLGRGTAAVVSPQPVADWAAWLGETVLSKPYFLPKVHAGGGLDAVGAVAEVDRVEVLLEDLLLAPLARQVVGQRRLAQLLEDRPVVLLGERVLDELLGDRRRALAGAAGDVGHERAGDAADVHPRAAEEALVLDRHDRVLHGRRDLLLAAGDLIDDDVVRRREDPDRPPAVVVEEGVGLLLVLLLVLQLGEVGGDRHHHPEHRRDEGQGAETDEDQEEAELAQPRLRRALAAASAARPPAPWRSERDGRREIVALLGDVDVVAQAIAGW